MEWQDGFALFWMMVDDTRAVVELRQRLNDYMRCHVQPMRYIKPQTAEGAAADTAQQIFHSEHIKGYPIWLDLSALDGIQDSNGPWHQARERTLSLLNKRRSQLENRIDSPIFIQLPRSFGPRIVEVAPDLWSVRQQVIDLPVAGFLSPDSSLKQEPLQPELSIPSAALEDAITQARQALAKTQAKFDKNNTYINHRNLAIKQSELAEYLVAIGNLDEANLLVRSSLKKFQFISDEYPKTPQVLRDLLIAFVRVGDVEKMLGDLKIAKDAFYEGLSIARIIQSESNVSLDAMKGVLFALSNVGDIEMLLGDFSRAKSAFQESLSIGYYLKKLLGDTPDIQRDISVTLERNGEVEYKLGNLAAAKSMFEESLNICRELIENHGSKPKELRDLSVSMSFIGMIEYEQGNLELAKSYFIDSLKINRQRREIVGDSPEILRDISVSLSQIGGIEQAQSDFLQAKELTSEGLQLDRQLYQSLGPAPQTVRDFRASLSNMIVIERELGNPEAAERYQQELERLKAEHPDYLKNA